MANRVKQNADRVLYVYGLTRNAIAPPRVAGVDGGSSVEPLDCAGLVCWISRVPRSQFADNLSKQMQDLDWLAQAGIRHQRVVSAIAESTDILPARFATVFLSENSLAFDLRGRKRTLLADFRKIQDSEEWGIKVFSVPPKAELPPANSRTGKDYLKAKAAGLKGRQGKSFNGDLERFSQELRDIAVDTAQGGTLSGGQRGLQFETSLLLKRCDRKKFDALLRKFSKEWAGIRQIEYSGPWPPYSFVSRSKAKA